jgi:hypothetical protein
MILMLHLELSTSVIPNTIVEDTRKVSVSDLKNNLDININNPLHLIILQINIFKQKIKYL